jgi:Zn-dependent protease
LYGLLFVPLSKTGSLAGSWFLQMVYTTAYLSLALMVFNLIPVSPLDGSKVLYSFLPDEAYYKLMRYERYGMILLLILVATGILGSPLSTATGWIRDKLFIFAEIGFDLYTKSAL